MARNYDKGYRFTNRLPLNQEIDLKNILKIDIHTKSFDELYSVINNTKLDKVDKSRLICNIAFAAVKCDDISQAKYESIIASVSSSSTSSSKSVSKSTKRPTKKLVTPSTSTISSTLTNDT